MSPRLETLLQIPLQLEAKLLIEIGSDFSHCSDHYVDAELVGQVKAGLDKHARDAALLMVRTSCQIVKLCNDDPSALRVSSISTIQLRKNKKRT